VNTDGDANQPFLPISMPDGQEQPLPWRCCVHGTVTRCPWRFMECTEPWELETKQYETRP
jgi:hypothetical protein